MQMENPIAIVVKHCPTNWSVMMKTAIVMQAEGIKKHGLPPGFVWMELMHTFHILKTRQMSYDALLKFIKKVEDYVSRMPLLWHKDKWMVIHRDSSHVTLSFAWEPRHTHS